MASTHYLANSTNFRPLPLVRANTLFRSDHLGALDENDAQQVRALGIRRVIDFRGMNERAGTVCYLPGVTVHSLAIEPTIVQKVHELIERGEEVGEWQVVELMQEVGFL